MAAGGCGRLRAALRLPVQNSVFMTRLAQLSAIGMATEAAAPPEPLARTSQYMMQIVYIDMLMQSRMFHTPKYAA